MPTSAASSSQAAAGKGLITTQALGEGLRERARALRSRPTAAEAALWEHLRGNRLGGLHFRRQQIIDGYIVDFYCHAAGLAVEVDGPVHEGQLEYDRARAACLAGRGLSILRFSNADVERDMRAVLARIESAARCQT